MEVEFVILYGEFVLRKLECLLDKVDVLVLHL